MTWAKTCSRSQTSSISRPTVTKSSGPGVLNMSAPVCDVVAIRVPGVRDDLLDARQEKRNGRQETLTAVEKRQSVRDRQLMERPRAMTDGLIRTMARL